MDQDIESDFSVDIASISVKLVLNIPNDSLEGSLSQNLQCFMVCRNCGDLWSISFMRVAYFKIVMDYDEACFMHLTPGVVHNFPKAVGV